MIGPGNDHLRISIILFMLKSQASDLKPLAWNDRTPCLRKSAN